MSKDKDWVEFELTGISRGLSVKDIQNAIFTLFPSPMKIPKEGPKFMTLEEFILDKGHKDER